jgi:HAE1 family hydrophobic/amphiphilic exporter-1
MNLTVMLASVMLIGLSVNAAILMIEEAVKNQNNGMSIRQSIEEASHSKLKAILMTSIAIMFGTLPQLFSTEATKVSMGAVIVGGIFSSLLFTLVLTPILYEWTETAKLKLKSIFSKKEKKIENN